MQKQRVMIQFPSIQLLVGNEVVCSLSDVHIETGSVVEIRKETEAAVRNFVSRLSFEWVRDSNVSNIDLPSIVLKRGEEILFTSSSFSIACLPSIGNEGLDWKLYSALTTMLRETFREVILRATITVVMETGVVTCSLSDEHHNHHYILALSDMMLRAVTAENIEVGYGGIIHTALWRVSQCMENISTKTLATLKSLKLITDKSPRKDRNLRY